MIKGESFDSPFFFICKVSNLELYLSFQEEEVYAGQPPPVIYPIFTILKVILLSTLGV